MPMKLAETEGEMQRWMEQSLELVRSLHYQLSIEGVLPSDIRKVGKDHPQYRVCRTFVELVECLEVVESSMAEHWGSTDGQMCPYDDCAHDLALKSDGWWNCPACLRDFYAVRVPVTGDYTTHLPGELKEGITKPDIIPMARDLGPSVLSPETWNDQD
jgi:hypothetical protein